MNILAGLYRPDAGEIRVDGRPVSFGSPRDAIEAGWAWSTSTSRWSRRRPSPRTSCSAWSEPRFLLDPRRSEAEVARLAAEFGLRVDPRAKIWQLQRRRAAAGRDPEAALPRRPDPDHGRADGRPGAAGDGGPVPDAPGDGRRRAERRLHQPQAERGRWRSPTGSRSCAAAGSRRRHSRAAGVTKRDLARLMVGRDLLGLYERTPSEPGDVLPRRRRTSRPTTTADCRRCGACRSRSASGEIVGIAAVAGNGQSELAEVITGLRRCAGQRPDRARDGQQPAAAARDPGRRRPRPRGPDRRRQRPEPVARRQPDHEALPGAAGLAGLADRRRPHADAGRGAQGAVRDRGAVGRDTGRGCSRAATSSG